MQTPKENIKRILQSVHLYNVAHRIRDWKPDLRMQFRNAGYRIAGATDGLTIPPTRLIYLVILSKEIAWYLTSGIVSNQSISSVLHKNGYSFGNFQNILDFGCGCARVLRHWRPSNGQLLYGTDYNQELITWCQKNLSSLAQFKTNQSSPPLDYGDNKFDFIYALSVFTHLNEDLQRAWMRELSRVLKPNGLLYITVHGNSRLYQLSKEEKQQYLKGNLVVKQEDQSGSNFCASFHPEQYVRSILAREYEIVDFVISGQTDMDQDVYLLRKP